MDLDAVRAKVETSIRKLRNRDGFLLTADTNERTITHKLAEYLGEEFDAYSVDCEYNRHQLSVKRANIPRNLENPSWDDTEAKTVFPDIIIHTRGNDLDNLLVVEVKKSTNSLGRDLDETKLQSFTRNMNGENSYGYSFGLFLDLSMSIDTRDKLDWYREGALVSTSVFPPLQVTSQSNS